MKSRRFQVAMVFDVGGQCQGGHRDIPAGPVFGGKDWCDLFVFALDEAERHGLSIGFNIQSGWNLGGLHSGWTRRRRSWTARTSLRSWW